MDEARYATPLSIDLTLACRNAWAMLAMSEMISSFVRPSSCSSILLLMIRATKGSREQDHGIRI